MFLIIKKIIIATEPIHRNTLQYSRILKNTQNLESATEKIIRGRVDLDSPGQLVLMPAVWDVMGKRKVHFLKTGLCALGVIYW